jgi:hypothetical protein
VTTGTATAVRRLTCVRDAPAPRPDEAGPTGDPAAADPSATELNATGLGVTGPRTDDPATDGEGDA